MLKPPPGTTWNFRNGTDSDEPSPAGRSGRLLSVPYGAEDTVNAMTVDVEDYFQVLAFARRIDRQDWPNYPYRVERNTEIVLQIFESHGIHATFFTLGWVAERSPSWSSESLRLGTNWQAMDSSTFRPANRPQTNSGPM